MKVNYVHVEGAENWPLPILYFEDVTGKTAVIKTVDVTETDPVTEEVRVVATTTYIDYV